MVKNCQRGMVLISVVGALMLMSVLLAHAAKQMGWLLQSAAQERSMRHVQAVQQLWVAHLHRLSITSIELEADSGRCWPIISGGCGHFYAEPSANQIWRFELRDQSKKISLHGWLRSEVARPNQVGAVWVEAVPGS